MLRYHNTDASIEALVICANKLGYYADQLRGSDDPQHQLWCERFDQLQALCELEIERQSQAKRRTPERMAA